MLDQPVIPYGVQVPRLVAVRAHRFAKEGQLDIVATAIAATLSTVERLMNIADQMDDELDRVGARRKRAPHVDENRALAGGCLDDAIPGTRYLLAIASSVVCVWMRVDRDVDEMPVVAAGHCGVAHLISPRRCFGHGLRQQRAGLT